MLCVLFSSPKPICRSGPGDYDANMKLMREISQSPTE